MTTEIARHKPATEKPSDQLLEQVRELKKVPVLQRGEGAVRLVEMMIVCIRDQERRIEELEAVARRPGRRRRWRRRYIGLKPLVKRLVDSRIDELYAAAYER